MRAGTAFPIENDRWIVTVGGTGRDYPPTDEAGFVEFARSLSSPRLYEAIKDAEPLSPIYGARGTQNRIRHYERLSRWPEGFVVMGDAVCAFNPVYGQGMSVSGIGAMTLDACLKAQRTRRPDGDRDGLARRFQQRLAKANAIPWLFATSEDFRVPVAVGGPPPFTTRLMHRYLDQLILLAVLSPRVNVVLGQVLHLVAPPIALFRPDIVALVVVRAAVRRIAPKRA